MTTLRAIKNHVIFQFKDNIVRKTMAGGAGSTAPSRFSEQTDWGFEISNYDESTSVPRWGIVVSAGPEAYDVQAGASILIEALKWTDSATFRNEKYWRTNVENILMVED